MGFIKKNRCIILGLFDKRQHNRQYIRLCYQYLPGIEFTKYSKYKAIIYGYLYILKQNKFQYTNEDANCAARNGHLNIIQYLQEHHNIKCTSDGAEQAAYNGLLHIIKYLYKTQGIKCTFAV